jgi:hypothetical protein
VAHVDDYEVPAAPLQQLLQGCPSLAHLSFKATAVHQDALEVILTHGTNITSLVASNLAPDSSIAGRTVAWRNLVLVNEDWPTVLHLANLPLQTVTSLQLSQDPVAGLGDLELPISSVPSDQLPGLLLQATTNLGGCPAWQSKPAAQIALYDDSPIDDDDTPATICFDTEQGLQLMHALAPLGGPHVKACVLNMDGCSIELGRAEVAALAQSLGKGLMSLRLSHCSLEAGFWGALHDALPSLQLLVLEEQVTCSAADVGIFCGRRCASGRPFLLRMSDAVYEPCEGDELQQGLVAQGLTRMKLRKC